MSTVKLAIVYYSATGTLDAMAHHAAEGAEKAGADIAALHHLATRVVTVAGRLAS